ncbi:MAG TPA: extracellular solute-binding protein [Thermoanaerobaculia bacterium]|nr:extracellular solute-binding protein [Thermoanaerobaculia bacterium]
MIRRRPLALLLAALLAAAGACRSDEPPLPVDEPVRRVTVYSEHDEAVVRPLLDRFTVRSGTEVVLETGAPGELAAALAAGEEIPGAGAAVFLSRDSAVLGRLAAAGRLVPLPSEVSGAVPSEMTDPKGRWVGLTARARLLAYAPERVEPATLPVALPVLAEARYRGRLALAPRTRSFLVHMAAYRALHGPEALDRLLASLAANEPVLRDDSAAVVAAVADGEADLGLVDHPALATARRPPVAPGAEPSLAPAAAVAPQAHLLAGSDSSGFLDLAGAAALSRDAAAFELIRFLLTPEAQADLTRRTREYPLVAGVPLPGEGMPPLADLDPPVVDFEAVAEVMDETQAQIEKHFGP